MPDTMTVTSQVFEPDADSSLGHLSVQQVNKIYDPHGVHVEALQDCTLEIPAGDFIAVVGPSGCGKSTLLNILAGFDNLTGGQVLLDDEPLATVDHPPRPGPDRVVVFQNGALFPWKTVLQNVVYGLLVQNRMTEPEANEMGMELLAKTGNLDRIAHSYPGQLSSGMQRRVEILRALINNPRILLLDEPFRAMDTVSKTTMHRHLLDIYDQYHKTVFFITHDLDEAIFLADTVVVMTTRPGTIKLRLDVDLPRPRTRETLTSHRFLELKQQAVNAVHEEAKKAFERGERELA
ncbi:MAG: ABC transporter ATP-binding protein [Gammaproteobacteria bacterium]|nr:ABC transporter ATP-binding protein [Gammaproteobacteria bacterium]